MSFINNVDTDQSSNAFCPIRVFTIGIKHVFFSCINIRQIPWEVLKTEAEGKGGRGGGGGVGVT